MMDADQLHADFPILQQVLHGDCPLAYLDNAATTHCPRSVIEAVTHLLEHDYASVHRGIHTLSERTTELFESVRELVRRFIGAAEMEEIVFTRGATEAINLVARSWGDTHLKRGDEIVVTEMEHHANIVPWQQVAARTGAIIRWWPIRDDGVLEAAGLENLLSDRTRLLAIAAASNVLGTINPLSEIIPRTHAAGALVMVDAAQFVPHMAIDVQQLDADFVAFSGHKMLAPAGVGVLYAKRRLLEEMPPFLGGGGMIRRVDRSGFEAAEPPAKFEAGTPPTVSVIGLGAAIEYLSRHTLTQIHEHEKRLTELAHHVLQEIPGLRLIGPSPEHKVGIVTFVLDGVHAHDIAQVLDRHGVAIRAGHHCAMPLHQRLGLAASARASFYLYNSDPDVTRLASGVRACQTLFAGRSKRR